MVDSHSARRNREKRGLPAQDTSVTRGVWKMPILAFRLSVIIFCDRWSLSSCMDATKEVVVELDVEVVEL